MAKLILKIDLGPGIPRAALELARPGIEGVLEKEMKKEFQQAGLKPQKVELEIED